MVEHVDIPDGEIHEPKGASTASSGEAYISDGAGSGSWYPVQKKGYAYLRLTTDTTTSGISSSYQVVDSTTLGITYDSAVNSSDISYSLAGGYLTFSETGMYHMILAVGLRGTVAGDRHYAFTIGVDSGAGFVEQSAVVEGFRSMDDATDTGNMVIACVPSITAGDKVALMAKVDSGTVSEVEIRSINVTFVRAD